MVIIIIIIIIGPLSFQRFFFLNEMPEKKVAFARIQFEQKKILDPIYNQKDSMKKGNKLESGIRSLHHCSNS